MPSIVATCLLTLLWLNPYAPGPSPAIMPWLVALSATAGALLLVSFNSLFEERYRGVPFLGCWVRPVACAWLLAGLFSSGIGFLQYFGATNFLEPWVNQTRLGEAFANLRQRNQFASLTNIAFAALIWFSISFAGKTGSTMQINGRRQALMLLAASLLAAGNAASSSRTGALQLLFLCALYCVWGVCRQPLPRRALLVVALTYCATTFLFPWLAGFDLSLHGMAARLRDGDSVCSSRLTLWSNVLNLIAQKPWFGWGWGELDYAHYITLYDGPRFCGILDNAHNLPLQLAVELGVPVALLVCGGFVWWILRQRPWLEADPTRQLAWSVMAVILLHSMLEYPLWYGPFQVTLGFCIGLLWQTAGSAKNAASGVKIIRNSPLIPVYQALLAIVLIVIASYAAWDYHRISQIYLAPQERDAAYREDTLAKIQGSWLFADQVEFAQLLLTPLTRDNAQWTFNTATELLHYSPEPRVIEKTIESAVMLGRNDEAVAHLARYRAAFPEDYARWTKGNAKVLSGLQFSK